MFGRFDMRSPRLLGHSLRAMAIGRRTLNPTLVGVRPNVALPRPMTATEFATSIVGTGGSFAQDAQGRTTQAWIGGRQVPPREYDRLCRRKIQEFERGCKATASWVATWRAER